VIAKTITAEELGALVADLVSAGTRVIAPARAADGKVDYRAITRFEEAAIGAELPRRSLKEFFLPPTEPLFSWHQGKGDVTVKPVAVSFPPHVVLGARPCDAAAVEILDRVMGWDYRDELWFGRREATTIVSVACPGVDGSCFCTATGGGPDSKRGSDLMMVPVDGGYLVEAVTPKGQAFVGAHAARFVDAADAGTTAAAEAFRTGVRSRVAEHLTLSLPALRRWLEGSFDHELWRAIVLRCHGCGACASVCPTCHCFDIVDEPEGVRAGTRRRNWDTCQTARFTVHASGHNPRADQNARFRQRVLHKFSIYPGRFGEVLCTGCGRCARACPGGMDLPEVLKTITALVGTGASREAAV
jgi:ferredoxin